MNVLYGVIVFGGFFFDFVVYSIWLKRKTEWAIVLGGISGAMPVLAGRVLGEGRIEIVGIALALAVLFWIPTHILTFTIRRADDYKRANIPTFPARYGNRATQLIIAFSSMVAICAILIASYWIGLDIGLMRITIVLSVALFSLTFSCFMKPNNKSNFWLYKFASLYMLVVMIIFATNSFF